MVEKFDYYKILQSMEFELTKVRFATFTALISISLVLPSLAFNREIINVPKINLILFNVSITQFLIMLGFLFFLFSIYHYYWFHRISHIYRKKLRKLEEEMDIEIYRLRTRPKLFKNIYLQFNWSLYIIGVFYGFFTFIVVGYELFISVALVSALILTFLMLRALNSKDEY